MGLNTHLAKVLANAGVWVEEGGAAAGGLTPLGLAALRGHTASVAALLAAGADPEAPLEGGATALMLAAVRGPSVILPPHPRSHGESLWGNQTAVQNGGAALVFALPQGVRRRFVTTVRDELGRGVRRGA